MSAAQGRLDHGPPIAVIDIGSNSVRLVIYEGLTRSPTPIFNEKVLAGLGREVQSTGLLAADAVQKALEALQPLPRAVRPHGGRQPAGASRQPRAATPRTARISSAEAERICRTKIEVLSGKREARLSALGVVSGFHRPDGIVGDLGGGSLELIDVHGIQGRHGHHATARRPGAAGHFRALDQEGREDRAEGARRRQAPQGRRRAARFYAVGGTWRSLARLHMRQTGYPLHVMHGYVIPAARGLEFARLVHRVNTETLSRDRGGRRCAPAAAGLCGAGARTPRADREAEEGRDLRARRARGPALSNCSMRSERRSDPLIAAANELNVLRSRSPAHGEELIAWTDRFMASTGLDETAEERRLRHAACLLADIGWRAHPDYRGEQSLNIIANAAFVGIDHPGRTFLALAVFFRHVGLVDEDLSPQLRELATDAHARSRPRARRRAARRLSGLRLDHRRIAEDADAGRTRPPCAAFRERLCGACRRARVRAPAPAGSPDRP